MWLGLWSREPDPISLQGPRPGMLPHIPPAVCHISKAATVYTMTPLFTQGVKC